MASPGTPDGLFLLVGAGLLVVGYLIKYRQWTWLISEATAVVAPDDAAAPLIASLVGNVTLVVGGTLVVLGGLQALALASAIPDWIVLLVLIATTVVLAPRLGYNLSSD